MVAGSLRDERLGDTLRALLLDGRSGQEQAGHRSDDAEGLDHQLCLREREVIDERPDTVRRVQHGFDDGQADRE